LPSGPGQRDPPVRRLEQPGQRLGRPAGRSPGAGRAKEVGRHGSRTRNAWPGSP